MRVENRESRIEETGEASVERRETGAEGAQEGAEPDYEQIATLKSKILQRQTELNTLLL